MIIRDIKSRWVKNIAVLSAKIMPDSLPSKPLKVWFLLEGIKNLPDNSGDPFLAGFLLPCMYEQENLKIEAPVSKLLLKNIGTIQNIMSNWYPELKKIKIICSNLYTHSRLDNSRNNCACFFSGGVDSSYTLLKHKDTIANLILINGFDIKLSNKELWSKALNSSQKISRELGKHMITVKTNIRTLTDKRRAKWGKKYNGDFWGKILHGSLLASVGLCLQSNLNFILIASGGRTEKDLGPWGIHPDLDSLWSTERLKFRHDDLETRTNKIKYISDYPVILSNLRVCYQNKTDKINCGICEKCIRTIITLKLYGKTPSPDIFAKIPTIKQIKLCRIDKKNTYLWNQVLEKAIHSGEIEIVNAINIALGKKFCFYRSIILIIQKLKYILKKLFYKFVKITIPPFFRKRIRHILNRLDTVKKK
jgi:hypothetical protein